MKKYLGLLIIVLILPLMSQEKAYAIPANLADDIYHKPGGPAFSTGEIRMGDGMVPYGSESNGEYVFYSMALIRAQDGLC